MVNPLETVRTSLSSKYSRTYKINLSKWKHFLLDAKGLFSSAYEMKNPRSAQLKQSHTSTET